MEFERTRWSWPWNSDQNCTENSARGWLGWLSQGVKRSRGGGGQGMKVSRSGGGHEGVEESLGCGRSGVCGGQVV